MGSPQDETPECGAPSFVEFVDRAVFLLQIVDELFVGGRAVVGTTLNVRFIADLPSPDAVVFAVSLGEFGGDACDVLAIDWVGE